MVVLFKGRMTQKYFYCNDLKKSLEGSDVAIKESIPTAPEQGKWLEAGTRYNFHLQNL
jgi:hypothetical protein